MSDTETTETKVDETEETKPEGEVTEETKTEETTEQKPEAKPEDELPEWARKELTKVRGEAANYRTKLRETEKKFSEAKTPEEFEAARTELSTRIAELEHEVAVAKVARQYEIPDELLPLLSGKPESELEAIAKTLQKYAAPAAPEHLSGGLTPDDGDESFDPAEVARAARRSRY
ncbi:head scaffolding protein [Streptomyces phage Celia]|uniref:Scaffolding protein n=1 Tax=Streptomyces phage Celia TaxID=2590946 RepID=A0A516KR93_9CAUD|nr:head scaffolding protein [Streptomyces phage Celia]QDP44212.1 scaffolding protein [Streptomyces phage Celia]QJD50574.1 scaffolding protein [Streptomyces phage Itza]